MFLIYHFRLVNFVKISPNLKRSGLNVKFRRHNVPLTEIPCYCTLAGIQGYLKCTMLMQIIVIPTYTKFVESYWNTTYRRLSFR